MGCGLRVRGFEEPLVTPNAGWWCSLFPKGVSSRSDLAVVVGGDVEPGCDGGAWETPQERSSRQRLLTVKHHSHACLPSDSQCRSLLGCSTAGQTPGSGQRIPVLSSTRLISMGAPLQHSRGATHQQTGLAASHDSAGPGHGPQRLASRNHHADSYWHIQGPLGTSRDGGAVRLESGWLIWKNLGQNKPREIQGSGSSLQWSKRWLGIAPHSVWPEHSPHRCSYRHWLMLLSGGGPDSCVTLDTPKLFEPLPSAWAQREVIILLFPPAFFTELLSNK